MQILLRSLRLKIKTRSRFVKSQDKINSEQQKACQQIANVFVDKLFMDAFNSNLADTASARTHKNEEM